MNNAQEQTKINIIPQGNELIIRHGNAEEIVYPKPLSISGTLAAPFQFLQGRGELDEKKIHLLIDTNNSQIQLVNNPTEHSKLVEGLMKWSANVETLVKEWNDNKGNSLFQLETRVKKADGFIESFMLNIPIFQGYPKVVFKVEIGLDPKHTGVDLFLISDELMTLIYQERERIITDEVKKFEKYSFSKVVIS